MKIMVIAAHPDDEVLGCGGTISKHVADGDVVHIVIVAQGGTLRVHDQFIGADVVVTHERAPPTLAGKACDAARVLGAVEPIFLDYPDQKLDVVPLLEVTQAIERAALNISPDIVYTHHAGDLNKDHRIVHEAVLTAFRPPSADIFAFEIASSTEWGIAPFWPDHFRDVTDHLEKKIKALECYDAEMRPPPHPRSYEGLRCLAKMRGFTVGCQSAEAFKTIRTVS